MLDLHTFQGVVGCAVGVSARGVEAGADRARTGDEVLGGNVSIVIELVNVGLECFGVFVVLWLGLEGVWVAALFGAPTV